MKNMFFRIISGDDSVCRRWSEAISSSGFQVLLTGTPGEAEGRACGAEVLLADIDGACCGTPETFAAFLKRRYTVAAILFGDPEKTPDLRIAAFLDAGADDFINKNIEKGLLLSKLNAHLRRLGEIISEPAASCTSNCGEITIDIARCTVKIRKSRGGYASLPDVTQREISILALLVKNESKVISRDYILDNIWGEAAEKVYPVIVNKYVESLRKKLGRCATRIRSVYGSGYMFTNKDAPACR